VVGKLADALESDFVFPAVGKQYAAMLRAKQAAGAYRNAASAEDFAAAVTSDLQAVHKDAHLKLFAPKTASSGQKREALAAPEESTISASGWIAPGVAYIAFDAFYGNDATMAELRTFLAKVRGAKTLIIDARHHRGGGMDEMNVLFPELFTKKTALVDMDGRVSVEQRLGGSEDLGPTVEQIQGPDGVVRRRHFALPAEHPGLGNAKVYLLTSHTSASAAEHMALALKRTHRATLIGETTRGAGNFGYPLSLGSGYSAFIPFGRTFDPDTDQGWEAIGVKPDVEVPADAALDEALKRAGVKVSGTAALAALN
jgi:C-terminal processing protease CtpA/Prc